MKKTTHTTKVNSLTDGRKTSVLVETIDLTTGEVRETLGVSRPSGTDKYDAFAGERIAFDKAYLSNLNYFRNEHAKSLKHLLKLVNEERKALVSICDRIDRAVNDLEYYSNEQEEDCGYDWADCNDDYDCDDDEYEDEDEYCDEDEEW